jgi:hypothetical protein
MYDLISAKRSRPGALTTTEIDAAWALQRRGLPRRGRPTHNGKIEHLRN